MQIGDYRLLVHRGPGHPGDWYLAQEETSGRAVRVLALWSESKDSLAWQGMARRFKLLAQVRHIAIVPMLTLDLEHEPPVVVLAEPAGMSLADHFLNGEEWPEQSVLTIGLALSGALIEAHRLGLVHGRLGPPEIWLDDHHRPAIDFAHGTLVPQEGMRTILARDQASITPGRDGMPGIDPADDLFALGQILHHMLHGEDAPGSLQHSFLGDSAEIQSLPSLVGLLLAQDRDIRPSAVETHLCLQRFLVEAQDQNRTVTRRPGGGNATPVIPYMEIKPSLTQPGERRLGRFRLLKKIGEGGLGTVYLGEDSVDGSQVAIKILHRHHLANAQITRRFKKEARLLADVQSPHICRLIEFNEDDGTFYLVMEFLQGQSLGRFLEKHKVLPEPLALAIVTDIARALGEAHRRGIVHRDIKPDNIMLLGPWAQLLEKTGPIGSESPADLPRVKLCDFGMARHVDQSESLNLTQAGFPMGTPLYMSPEQANAADEITPRSDVYSLGVTLFHVLTGRPPFQAPTIPALLGLHLKGEIPSPQDLNPDLSSAISLVVQKSLAKDPQARYADADEFLLDLERLVRGEPTNLVVHPSLPKYDAADLLCYDWSWDLQATPEQLWPLVSNTERLNRAVGIPAVNFILRVAGQAATSFLPKVERIGSFRKAGFTNTWREHPFEWIEGRRMSVLREYSEGVFLWFASIVELQPRPDGGTTLHHRVRIVPRGRLGRLVAALEVGFKGRRAVEKVYRRIDSYLSHDLPQTPATDPFEPQATSPVKDARVFHRLLEQLIARGVDPLIADPLIDFLLLAPEQEIARIRPIALAERLGLNPNDVIDACLVAAHEGILMVLWDILCPKCRIPAAIEETMQAIQSHGRCQACNLDFELDFANSVEMIFRVQPRLRATEVGTYCIGGPSHSPHVVAQVRVAPGERLELAMSLTEGSYRLRGPQLSYTVDFRVHPDARATRGELVLAKGPDLDFPRTFRVGSQIFVLANDHGEELVARVERLAPRLDALTAAHVSTLARFRDLFPQQVLAGHQLVSLAHVVLLTTDLVGAAELYRTQGDARAFGILHEHFRILDDHIRRESGALVKTINEGILATFHDAAAAVRVALDLSLLLSHNTLTQGLRLRVGLHQGSAMAATINGKLDYFGTTVNLATRLPSLAASSDILLTQALASDPQVVTLLQHRGLACQVLPVSPDWPADLPIYRLAAQVKLVIPPTTRKGQATLSLKRLAQTPIG